MLCVGNSCSGWRDNVLHRFDDPRFEQIRHDATFRLCLELAEICNLARPVSPIHWQYDPVQTVKTNVHGAINMLGLAERTRVRILNTYGPRMHSNSGRAVSNFIVQALEGEGRGPQRRQLRSQ